MTKTILISGNFNILHPRHLLLLRFSKELGDKLIFAVYTDKWEINLLKNIFNKMTVNIIITTLKEKKYISPNLFCLQ